MCVKAFSARVYMRVYVCMHACMRVCVHVYVQSSLPCTKKTQTWLHASSPIHVSVYRATYKLSNPLLEVMYLCKHQLVSLVNSVYPLTVNK